MGVAERDNVVEVDGPEPPFRPSSTVADSPVRVLSRGAVVGLHVRSLPRADSLLQRFVPMTTRRNENPVLTLLETMQELRRWPHLSLEERVHHRPEPHRVVHVVQLLRHLE